MTTDDAVDLIITIDRTTGKILRTAVKEPGAQPREVQLDVDEIVRIIKGGDDQQLLIANRTGPDPRRL